MEEHGVANLSMAPSDQRGAELYFAQDNKLVAHLTVADEIKSNAAEAIQLLRTAGVEVVMASGDNLPTTESVASTVGVTRYHAGMLPDDKLKLVTSQKQSGHVVAMVGDGINDAPALATADVSVAMGSGADIAIDVAAITIVSNDLMRLPQAFRLSRKTMRTIRQNLFWAFIYNVIGIPVAAGILYPFFGFTLNPMLAGAAMALSSVSVVANSLRLRAVKL